MPTAYIPTTIHAQIGSVFLFETECVAEVEYLTERGALQDWVITDFKFQDERYDRDEATGQLKRTVRGEAWCPDILRPTLMEYVDRDRIEESLREHLAAEGETYASDEARRDYHAAVM